MVYDVPERVLPREVLETPTPTRDDAERELIGREAPEPVSGPGEPSWKAVTVGLVGFHIAQKTETSPQWIWSTFEHVDNLATNRLQQIAQGGYPAVTVWSDASPG